MVATVGRARGGPAGVADEPVMSRAPGPPLFPGSHLKSPFLSARAGRAETKAGGAEDGAERPLLEAPFQSWGRRRLRAQLGLPRSTRGARCP